LARTIVRFKQVSQARIHLVIPKRSLYWEKEKQPTASVWLKLRGGAGLERGQVRAVVHLVAGAVEGLSPENITVVDSLGETLTESEQSPSAGLTQSQLTLRRETEKMYEDKIVSLLQPIVGQNKVRARVSVSMDFKEVELEEENYDPTEQVLRSEQELNEESGKPNEVGGVPGTRSNLGQEQAAPTTTKENNYIKRTQRTRNYEVGKTIRKTTEHPGEIKRVSAAVILDDKAVIKEEGGERNYEYEPLSAVEIAKCRELVEKAIGFSKDRGDMVVVENLSFDRQAVEEEQFAAAQDQREAFWSRALGAVRTPLLIICLILVFVLVIRPLMKGVVVRGEALAPATALAAVGRGNAGLEGLPGSEMESEMALEGKTVEEIEAEMLAGETHSERTSKRNILVKRINQIIQREPDTALQLLRALMQSQKQ
ncbi:MAG TPA: flagellar basal-body MS-ring/collar protein FliF, partial [bacterium]|nr:flagellar basal-body MS-ring/collar protein FliF [bacterium]